MVRERTYKGGSEKPIEGKCGSKLRKSDPVRYCTKSPIKGRKRCQLHGGKAKRGIAASRFRTGEYSKFIPKNLRETVDSLLAPESEMSSMRLNIAVAQSHLFDLLKDVDGDAIALRFAAAVEAWNRWEKIRLSGSEQEQLDAYQSVREALASDVQPERIWGEIFRTQEHVRKLSDTALKHLKDNEGTISIELHLQHFDRLLGVVFRAFQSHQIPRQVVEEIQDAYSAGTGRTGDVLEFKKKAKGDVQED